METRVTLEEYQQLERSLGEKVMDKATSDPTWKQQLTDDPDAALEAANFPKAQRLQEIYEKNLVPPELSDDVHGHDATFSFKFLKLDVHTVKPMELPEDPELVVPTLPPP